MAATEPKRKKGVRPRFSSKKRGLIPIFPLLLASASANATVLPEERADALFHQYDGGGLTVSGPSVLVRKNFRDKVSVSANYYVDNVTSASIDVVTTASPYTEQREQVSVGVDYLHDKTTMGLSWTRSEESDYLASTTSLSWSQDFFGDLSTLSFGISFGSDTVMRNGDPAFSEGVDRESLRLGFAQVLSRNAVLGLALDVTADQGYLHNPYRSVRYLDTTGTQALFQGEVYPRTHTSNALALRVAYHLPWQDAIKGEIRTFSDTWGVDANNVGLTYTRDLAAGWHAEARVRQYSQGHADFYSDLFPYRDAANYLARDKELSTFENFLYGFGIGYSRKSATGFWKQVSANLDLDFVRYDYADFRDLRSGLPPGTEPFYGYDAVVTRAFVSLWY